MDNETIITTLIFMVPVAKAFMCISFLLIWAALLGQAPSGKLGMWINILFFLLASLGLFNTFFHLDLNRTDYFANTEGDTDWIMLVGIITMPVIVALTGLRVGYLTYHSDSYAISNEGVFGTMAQYMPIVIANHIGIIQYTTTPFDELSGYDPGELIGKDLKVIMPERYKHRHDRGMAHYVETKEARIVGKPVTVEMLRKDGTEITIQLALNVVDVDGLPWFVAALWEKEENTPDTLISKYEIERNKQ